MPPSVALTTQPKFSRGWSDAQEGHSNSCPKTAHGATAHAKHLQNGPFTLLLNPPEIVRAHASLGRPHAMGGHGARPALTWRSWSTGWL